MSLEQPKQFVLELPLNKKEEFKYALQQTLDFCEQQYKSGQQKGYFSKVGWAGNTLYELLEKLN
jgi:hypothetical protein